MNLEFQWTPEEIIAEGRTTRENLETIRKWRSNLNDKNIPLKIQDEMIVLFLLSCCNDIDLTKNTIVSYYKCKKNGPEIYDDRNLENPDIKLALNTM